jgi:hypothetical protein
LDKDKGVGIGWTHMLEGKITGISELYNLSLHLQQQCNAHINGQDWVKLFISTKSVKISLSHTIWIFPNLTLPDKTIGHLTQLKWDEL